MGEHRVPGPPPAAPRSAEQGRPVQSDETEWRQHLSAQLNATRRTLDAIGEQIQKLRIELGSLATVAWLAFWVFLGMTLLYLFGCVVIWQNARSAGQAVLPF